MKPKEKSTLVFFGSGPVAAGSLVFLKDFFDIEAVVTKPSTAREMETIVDAKIHCVSTKRELDQLIKDQIFKSSVAVLVDFGVILSDFAIKSFDKGVVNSHFSMLPELRGADPIAFTILEGKGYAGVSLMMLVEAMDEGPLLVQDSFSLNGNETTPELTKKLIDFSNKMLRENLPRYIDGSIQPVDQKIFQKKTGLASGYTRKLNKSDGEIDWKKPAREIEREIRAFNDWPKSRCKLSELEVIIVEASVTEERGKPGELFVKDKKLGVFCGTDSLIIETIKPAGKKAMDSSAFLAGYKSRIDL